MAQLLLCNSPWRRGLRGLERSFPAIYYLPKAINREQGDLYDFARKLSACYFASYLDIDFSVLLSSSVQEHATLIQGGNHWINCTTQSANHIDAIASSHWRFVMLAI